MPRTQFEFDQANDGEFASQAELDAVFLRLRKVEDNNAAPQEFDPITMNNWELWKRLQASYGSIVAAQYSSRTQISFTSGTWIDLTNATVNITTTSTGKIYVTASLVNTSDATGSGSECEFRIAVDSEISDPQISEPYDDLERSISMNYVTASDYASGTHTVKIQCRRVNGTATLRAEDISISVFALSGLKGDKGDTGSGSNVMVQDEGVDVSGTPHSILNFIGSLVAVTNAGSGKANITINPIFGADAQNAIDAAEATTTNTAFQQKLRITTPTLAAATYRIGWSYEWRHTGGSNDFRAQVQVDDTTTLMSHRQEPQDTAATQSQPASGFAYVTFATSAAHNIDLDYCTSNAGGTAAIKNARLEIWRVS
jgi:hypothetical protein